MHHSVILVRLFIFIFFGSVVAREGMFDSGWRIYPLVSCPSFCLFFFFFSLLPLFIHLWVYIEMRLVTRHVSCDALFRRERLETRLFYYLRLSTAENNRYPWCLGFLAADSMTPVEILFIYFFSRKKKKKSSDGTDPRKKRLERERKKRERERDERRWLGFPTWWFSGPLSTATPLFVFPQARARYIDLLPPRVTTIYQFLWLRPSDCGVANRCRGECSNKGNLFGDGGVLGPE